MSSSRLSSSLVLSPLLAVLSQAAFAVDVPTAGSQLQQIQPAPMQQREIPPQLQVKPEAVPATPVSAGQKIIIRTLTIVGAKMFPESTLLGLTGFVPGTAYTLAELRVMAAKISDFYRRKGYFVAQVFLPPQDIKQEAITVQVLEGNYGQINLKNQSKAKDSLIKKLLAGLNPGDTIDATPLEERLLLISDLPGVIVNSVMAAGTEVGTSDLNVDITAAPRVTGSLDADNQGNRYTGADRLGASVYINEITGLGDSASVRVLSSGTGLNYARLAYQMQFGRLKLGVAYADMAYRLGHEFTVAQLRGNAQVATLFGGYALHRSRNSNLSLQLGFDNKTFQDKQGADATFVEANKTLRVLSATLSGDNRDGVLQGGENNYSTTLGAGNASLKNPTLLANDAVTAKANGQYLKLAYTLSRQQNLTNTVSLYGALNGQFASKNLDASEKISLGGATGVRAYPVGETNGDQGYILNLEMRKQFGAQTQVVGFVDNGSAMINKTPWAAVTTPNHHTLSGIGAGVNWSSANNKVMVKAFYATRLGSAPAVSAPDTFGRFWLQAVTYF